MKYKYIKLCLKCGSANIKNNPGVQSLAGAKYSNYCGDCEHGFPNGAVFPEVEISKVEEFRKKLKKQ